MAANAYKGKYSAVAVQFVAPAETAQQTTKIANLISLQNPRTAANLTVLSDQIHVWRSDGTWTKYYNKTGVGYVKSDAADKSKATEDTIGLGDGVFFRRGNAADDELITSGGLYEAETATYSLPKSKYIFLANPWPVPTMITNLAASVTNPRAAANLTVLSDQIHVWNNDGTWTKYFNKTSVGYVRSDAEDKSVPTQDSIEPGVCVFFRKGNAIDGTVTFTKPQGL